MRLVLDLKKDVNQNASIYFDKAKRCKRKIEGARKAISELKEKLDLLEKKYEKERQTQQKQKKEKRKKQWYEKFRWFFTSEGFLVIGGRDAITNEIIIKKHADKNDLVFHTDMAGSPFFIIKQNSNPNKKITDKSLSETASATFIFSRAFSTGYYTAKVFYVNPDQVTKEAKAGEYLKKGAFVIKGKTNYVEPSNSLAIGLFQQALMCAPLESVKANCKEYIELRKGQKKPSDIAKLLKKYFDEDIDEIIRVLPASNLEIKDIKMSPLEMTRK